MRKRTTAITQKVIHQAVAKHTRMDDNFQEMAEIFAAKQVTLEMALTRLMELKVNNERLEDSPPGE